MRRKNEEYTGPSGVLLVDKAPDMTSHDVVAIARRALNTKKIGHCGTLDPMATGLLMLVIGKATKIQDLLMSEDKVYEGTLTLGERTSTQDRQGEVLETREVGDYSEEEIKGAFDAFKGEYEQLPPMVSAIKMGGVPLYKMARKGQEVERKLRPVRVTGYQISRTELPEIDFRVECSKGFYVRTYANDIGEKLGCGGHLSALRRTNSGKFTLERAVTVAQLKEPDPVVLATAMISLAEISLMRGA
ncbi:MAG: tRNA pseudouridine(55) synthase TruB [Akkermansiaceae bacterium]|jgi:tRNA pseudouridine55 synthase|nr:tRNA pseudouridine(55) synthase TruB [Akkermansiaceae bacterium]MDP4646523.1 tRNA pseudouridine(55) synthase TruB [Akkermansiaceae bacterium]MDP4720480.1 tRNA pseudouridine(55) synthase TruB [Akkermansiaceae bacterium]MDP4779316.1 tRNA pseudouridine(55) synthase TruB [Akkermansiaceae bacterium]MDP4846480.1 tRNA pseudouridine(55) synthase TruB [Akkermansiaceae bacterium]